MYERFKAFVDNLRRKDGEERKRQELAVQMQEWIQLTQESAKQSLGRQGEKKIESLDVSRLGRLPKIIRVKAQSERMNLGEYFSWFLFVGDHTGKSYEVFQIESASSDQTQPTFFLTFGSQSIALRPIFSRETLVPLAAHEILSLKQLHIFSLENFQKLGVFDGASRLQELTEVTIGQPAAQKQQDQIPSWLQGVRTQAA